MLRRPGTARAGITRGPLRVWARIFRDSVLAGVLRLESGVPEAARRALGDLGWPIGAPDGSFGRYQCIERTMHASDRVYAAASEMRADGTALAY